MQNMPTQIKIKSQIAGPTNELSDDILIYFLSAHARKLPTKAGKLVAIFIGHSWAWDILIYTFFFEFPVGNRIESPRAVCFGRQTMVKPLKWAQPTGQTVVALCFPPKSVDEKGL